MRIFWVFIFSFSVSILFAQNDFTVDIKLLSREEGLPSNNIFDIIKDSRGNLWIATYNGLSRFDGETFESIPVEGLQTIHQLVEDDQGFIWVVEGYEVRNYNVQNIAFLDIKSQQLISFEERFKAGKPFDIKEVSCLKAHEDGLLIGTKNGLVGIFSKGNFHWIPFKHQLDDVRFIEKAGPNFWLYITNETRTSFQWILINPEGKILNSLSNEEGTKMTRIGTLSDSSFFYSTISTGQEFKILELGKKSATYRKLHFLPEAFHKNEIAYYDFLYGNKNAEVFISRLNGIFRLHRRTDFSEIYQFPRDEIFNQVCRKIISTKENNFWLATSNGLFVIQWKPQLFQKLLIKPNLSPSVRGIWVENNHLIANTYKGSFELDLGSPQNWKKLSFIPEDEVAIALNKDRQGRFCFGTKKAIYIWDKQQDQVQSFSMVPNKSAFGPETFVALDSGLLLQTKRGIGFLNYQTGQIKFEQAGDASNKWFGKFNYRFATTHTLNAFQIDKSGQIWGLSTDGAFLFDMEKGLHQRLSKSDSTKNYLPASNIRHFYEDSDGIMWFSSGDNGLIRFDRKKKEGKKYQLFNTDNALPTNVLYSLFGDSSGKLWLSSNYGLILFDKQSHEARQYLLKDGISAEDFNRISHFQDKNGKIYFGSLDGITAFHPLDFEQEIGKEQEVDLFIQECEVYNSRAKRMLNKTEAVLSEGRIILVPGDRFINLSFLLDEYIDQDKVKYSYKIDGYQEEWVESRANNIRISGLPYGKFELNIKAKLPNGIYSKHELNLPIIVRPPFFLRWWFISLASILLLALLLYYNRWRGLRFKKQQNLLEHLVNERTQTIQSQNLQLQEDKRTIAAQATKIKEIDQLKTRFFTNVSHEFRTPLSLILGPLRSVLKNQSISNKDFTRLKKAERNAEELLRMVNEILDISKLEAGELKLEEEAISLYHRMHRIFAAFESQALYSRIQYLFEYQPADFLNVLIDAKKLDSIIANLISNALKFTPEEGKIIFGVEELPNRIRFEISDTGIGIAQEEQAYIFNRFYQAKTQKAISQSGGTGIGLSICHEYALLMDAHLWVESPVDNNKGSRFILECPKKIIALHDVEGKEKLPAKQHFPSEKTPSTEPLYTILIVEDNANLRQYLDDILALNYKVVTATNGLSAIDLLSNLSAKELPCLIIADVLMPEMDGFQLLEQLKLNTTWSNIPTIMLTARAKSEDKLKALRIGVDDYIIKPFVEEELLVRIENLLNNYSERLAFKIEPAETQVLSIDQQWLEALEKAVLKQLGAFNLTMDQLAKELNMSRTSFFNKVKKLTGLSPNQYLQEARLNRARKLLEHKQVHSVKEVAFKVGIKNVKYFSKLFKKRFGDLPSDHL